MIIRWLVSVRLNESLYSVNSIGDNGISNNDSKRLDQKSGAENSCVPVGFVKKQHNTERETNRQIVSSSLTGQTFYVDVDVPAELRRKVDLKFLWGIFSLISMMIVQLPRLLSPINVYFIILIWDTIILDFHALKWTYYWDYSVTYVPRLLRLCLVKVLACWIDGLWGVMLLM